MNNQINLKFFHAQSSSGCDTFLKAENIVSIVCNEAQDQVLIGMSNGEHFGCSGSTIRSLYQDVLTDKSTSMDYKNLAQQILEIIKAL